MPKIIGASLGEHREEIRRRLFAALAVLMDERGFAAISLADIAAAAGIGRTAVYNHVPDKESLLVSFVIDETEQHLATLRQALGGVTDPVERLRIYIRHQLRVHRSLHAPAGLCGAVSPATWARLRDLAEPARTLLRSILGDGIAAGAFAKQPLDVAVPLVDACLSARGGPARGPDRDAATSATEAFVLRAVGVPPG